MGLSFGQETQSENYAFRYIKSKENSKIIEGNTSNYFINIPKGQKKIQIRFKMESLSGRREDFDPNKFYLVSDEYKVRVRPIDVKHNTWIGMYFLGFTYLNEYELEQNYINAWVSYDPNVTDTFWNYKINGYQDISPIVNVGTKKKPINISPYFKHKKLRACRIDVYFSVPEEFEKGKIYFGENVISDFNI